MSARHQPGPWFSLAVFASMLLAVAVIAWQGPLRAGGEEPEPGITSAVLAPGESATSLDGLRVTFLEVVSDSRCPMDVMCVWMGEAVVLLEVQPRGGEAERLEIVIGVTAPAPIEGGPLDGVTLDLQPYPLASQPHAPEDARLHVDFR